MDKMGKHVSFLLAGWMFLFPALASPLFADENLGVRTEVSGLKLNADIVGAALYKKPCYKIAYVSKISTSVGSLNLADDCNFNAALKIKDIGSADDPSFFTTLLDFRPDGRTLAFGEMILIGLGIPIPLGIEFFDLTQNPPTPLAPLDQDLNNDGKEDFTPLDFSWSPDGSKFALITWDLDGAGILPRSIRIADNPSDLSSAATKFTVASDPPPQIHNLSWTHENSLVFSMSDEDGQMDLYALDLNGSLGPQKIPGASEADVGETDSSVSRDGKKLLFVKDRSIWACDLKISIETIRVPDGQDCPGRPFGNPFCVPRFRANTVQTKSHACENLIQLTRSDDPNIKDGHPCFSPDGQYVFFISNRLHAKDHTDREIWRTSSEGSTPVDVSNTDADEETIACGPAERFTRQSIQKPWGVLRMLRRN